MEKLLLLRGIDCSQLFSNYRRIILSILLLLTLATTLPTNALAASVQMYFGGNDFIIQKANLDGSGIENVITGPITLIGGTPNLAANTAGGKMYIGGIGKINRANLDGTNFETIVPAGSNNFQGLAVDSVNGKIYFSDPTIDKIQRANLDGTGIEDVITSSVSGFFNPFQLALDLIGEQIYIANGSRISRANLDGTGYEDLVTGTNFAAKIALDIAGGKMYWTEIFSDSIRRANLDGTAVENLVTGLQQPGGLALDVASGKMYFTDSVAGTIQRGNLDGTGIESLFSGVNYPATIALYSPVPVPAAVWLFGSGLLGLIVVARKKQA